LRNDGGLLKKDHGA
ncbi:hypothetical protein SOVF_167790, partial [Spinacia oleracea]